MVDAVVEKVKSQKAQDYVVRWVETNVRGKNPSEITVPDTDMGSFPAEYRLGMAFDWGVLGFENSNNQVRGVKGKSGEIDVVYFGNPRFGVFVSVDGSIFPANHNIVFRTERIAVYYLKAK